MYINEEITSWVPAPQWLIDIFKNMAQDNYWGFLTLAIAAPVLEEILMRGIVLDGLLKNYNPWKAIIWSSVLFGFIHFNLWQFVGAFTIGIVMGYLYWKTKSLLLCMFIHALNNVFAFFSMKLYPEATSWFDIFNIGVVERVVIFFIAIFIVWVAYKYFEKYFSSKELAE